MVKTLHFSTVIEAKPQRVWDTMLQPDTYRIWTAEFAPGSYYEGSWNKGESIRFLSPEGGGMLSEIAESRPPEFISIKHVGYIKKDGVPDTTSDEIKSWAPAYENYTLSPVGASTEVKVACDVTPDFEEYMNTTWPKALAKLKAVCESLV